MTASKKSKAATVVGVQNVFGGAGATSIVAGLAVALCAIEHRAIAIDLNRDNSLCLHFGMEPTENQGIISALHNGSALLDITFESRSGYPFIPMGMTSEERHISETAEDDMDKLADLFAPLFAKQERFLIIDLPTEPSALQRWAYRQCDLVLNIVRPEPRLIRGLSRYLVDTAPRQVDAEAHSYLLLNGVAPQVVLQRDSMDFIRGQIADGRLVPLMVNSDQHVPEAFAQRCPVRTYQPKAQAARDFDALALWVVHEVAERSVAIVEDA
ncbi:MAG: hypothetical protein LAT77_00780 [Aliidiomarina sp.]|uniref:cellulose synthase operon protein YhjQ/BcsQ n=1 Tax=Aliidiomarina sp. TaxID=1872439 RepID=UPI0025BB29D5|nr:cellulose synthase operon protein YhjQ/BcsQ [Aliidiomarina sp.]MCH8500426.1 hypothetical protein [Aliidiomarina sp.]